MPKILNFTPEWLSSSPALDLFKPTPTDGPRETHYSSSNGFYSGNKRSAKPGPRRTIAHRNSEVFIAVGKEIRWADVVYLKEKHEEKKAAQEHGRSRRRDSNSSEDDPRRAQGYRVCCSCFTLQQKLMMADYQNTSCRGHTTTCYFAAWKLHCYPNDAYRTYCTPTRTFTFDCYGC